MKAIIGTDIKKAASLLQEGELVAIPTETVYGLAGNATDSRVVSMIFQVKNRPFFDPMIMHAQSIEAALPYIGDFPDVYKKLADIWMPGPLTLLCKKSPLVPDILTAGSDKVAVRIPNHPLTLQLLKNLPFPLAAPSANPFGYISPTTPGHVADQLGDKIPYILDGGPCAVGVESTILDYRNGSLIVLRKGGVSIEELEVLCGKVEVMDETENNPAAPGMLKSHYSPATPLRITPPYMLLNEYSPERIGYLGFQKRVESVPANNQFILSESGDLREAARNLFTCMRKLDNAGVDVIAVELVPDHGLGKAINDKLRRASV